MELKHTGIHLTHIWLDISFIASQRGHICSLESTVFPTLNNIQCFFVGYSGQTQTSAIVTGWGKSALPCSDLK